MSTTAYVLINGIISTNLFLMKLPADAASCGCRPLQPTVVERQQTRCVYVCNSLIVLGGQVYLFFKTLRKNRCLACNSFPHHWNKAEYSGDAPDDDDLDYNQHFIVIHSQPIIILIGVHWFIKFRTQLTLNWLSVKSWWVPQRPLTRSNVLQNPGYGWNVDRLDGWEYIRFCR